MSPDKEVRPRLGTEGEQESKGRELDSDPTAPAPWNGARRGYAVRVLFRRADGCDVSQLFTSLPAAEAKVQRTRGRGLPAWLELVRVVVVAPFDDPEVGTILAEDGETR